MDGILVAIGGSENEYVRIWVTGRQHPGSRDRWDGDWLRTPIEVSVAGFSADIPGANLRGHELRSFRHDLERLRDDLNGEARLESMEHWLNLSLRIDALGGIRLSGQACANLASGHPVLNFELELDQSFLPAIIAALAEVEIHFPEFSTD